MLQHYYFNRNADDKGRHEVHTEHCAYQPNPYNRVYIGYFSNCKEAIAKAKSQYPYKTFDGCFYCCYECHKG